MWKKNDKDMAYSSTLQTVNNITYTWIGESEYGNVDCFPASEYFDCDDMWLAEGATAPVAIPEPKKTDAELIAEYTAHVIGQDNRNAAAMASAFGTKAKKYSY